MTLLRESASLHERVRAFARTASHEPDVDYSRQFEDLALEIARFQARWSAGYARLVRSRGSSLQRLSELPAVPAEAFRITRVAAHEPDLDAVRFETSGTTGEARGVHAIRDVSTYRQLAVAFGARALIADSSRKLTVVALAPRPSSPPISSLGFMMQAFIEEFDGRALGSEPEFDPHAPRRWLVTSDGVDVEALRAAGRRALRRSEPLLVLATSFALMYLLDALGEDRVECPDRTVVMQTGGFKGRTREISASTLRTRVAGAFGIAERQVVGEYGMTELTSQLYEGTLPGAELRGAPGFFLAPPWLRVDAVDPATLDPLPPGEVGVARFIDLGNVDSAVAVVTQDQVRCSDGGLELLGRLPGSAARGCSLAIESLVG